jgi:protein required for attachment to host cells
MNRREIMKDQARKTWIVVADGGHARILLNTHRDEGVEELPLVSKTDPRLASHHGELAAGVHHTPVFKPDDEQRDEGRFMDLLAETLQTGAARKECDSIVLVAPANVMGHLRKALNAQTQKLVVAEVIRDYAHQDNQTIYKHVKDKLPL